MFTATEIVERPPDQAINICWKTNSSTEIIIGSNQHLQKAITRKALVTSVPKGSVKINIRILGKLPYANITYWQDGDEYYSDYHLFCKYIGIDNSPFDEITYKYENRLGYFWDDLDLSKKIK